MLGVCWILLGWDSEEKDCRIHIASVGNHGDTYCLTRPMIVGQIDLDVAIAKLEYSCTWNSTNIYIWSRPAAGNPPPMVSPPWYPPPAYIHTGLPTYLPTLLPTYVCTYVRTYIHTYIKTYTHTCLYLPTYVGTYILHPPTGGAGNIAPVYPYPFLLLTTTHND